MSRILLLDIETSPNVVLSWGLKVDGYLPHENIVEERAILCASWKWLDGKSVGSITAEFVNGKPNDERVARKIHSLLSSCDAVIAHNGDRFDIPWSMTRIIYHGLPPPPAPVSIDTKKIAKARFYFNSNRLDYLGGFLGLGNKIRTEFDLWKLARKGDRKAMREMVRYNREDVRLLERVYLKLRAYEPAKLNRALVAGNERLCPTCESPALQLWGVRRTRASTQQRLRCSACGAFSQRPFGGGMPR